MASSRARATRTTAGKVVATKANSRVIKAGNPGAAVDQPIQIGAAISVISRSVAMTRDVKVAEIRTLSDRH